MVKDEAKGAGSERREEQKYPYSYATLQARQAALSFSVTTNPPWTSSVESTDTPNERSPVEGLYMPLCVLQGGAESNQVSRKTVKFTG